MQVNCPSCGSLLHSEDMNLATMAGKCQSCHALVNLQDYLPPTKRPDPLPASSQRPRVPMPSDFAVDDSGIGLQITRRWFSRTFIFLVFFCIAWDSFLVFWYSTAFNPNTPWIVKVFPIGHVAVGIGLTYFTIAGFVNRTTIHVDGEELTIRHGPLPWFGNRCLPVRQLDQLYSQQEASRNRDSVSYSYKVNAVTREGKKITLLSGLTEGDQALFVEQQLETYLRIKDRPVPGELPR